MNRCWRAQCAPLPDPHSSRLKISLPAPSAHSRADGACVKCAPGTASPGGVGNACELCPPGTHTPSPGYAFCVGCKHDTYASGWGSTECLHCVRKPRRRLMSAQPFGGRDARRLMEVEENCPSVDHSSCGPCICDEKKFQNTERDWCTYKPCCPLLPHNVCCQFPREAAALLCYAPDGRCCLTAADCAIAHQPF
jgi:hypothetical protein